MQPVPSSATTALLLGRLQVVSIGLIPSHCLKEAIAKAATSLSTNTLVCMALKPSLSWLTQQLSSTQDIGRDSSWEYPQQPHRRPHPGTIPGESLLWELCLPLFYSLWPAGLQSLLCGSASLGGSYGPEESRMLLESDRQALKPTPRALPWFCTLIAPRVWSGSTCAGARCDHASSHVSPNTLDPAVLNLPSCTLLHNCRTAGCIVTATAST